MKFYQDANELIENETPIRVRSQLYPYFQTGLTAFKELVQENEKIFQSDFFHNIRGWVLNYMMFRQFESDMLSKTFPFIPLSKKVNNFNYKTLNLISDNLIINVAKSIAPRTLPNRSQYRRRYCRLNEFNKHSLYFAVDPSNQLVVKNEPYFMFLTYGVTKNEIQFVDLVVPNHSMRECLAIRSLKDELSVYTSESMEETVTSEKKVAILKNDVLEKLKLIKGEVNE